MHFLLVLGLTLPYFLCGTVVGLMDSQNIGEVVLKVGLQGGYMRVERKYRLAVNTNASLSFIHRVHDGSGV